jgi:hypothetical protein
LIRDGCHEAAIHMPGPASGMVKCYVRCVRMCVCVCVC